MPAARELLDHLHRRLQVGDRRGDVEHRIVVQDVRALAPLPAVLRQAVEHPPLLRPIRREVDLGAQEVVDEEVALDLARPGSLEHEHGAEAEPVAGAHRLSRRVRLEVEPDENDVGLLGHRARQAELEVAELVAAQRHPGEVVALHEDAGPGERPGEVRRLDHRRRPDRDRHPRDPRDLRPDVVEGRRGRRRRGRGGPGGSAHAVSSTAIGASAARRRSMATFMRRSRSARGRPWRGGARSRPSR